VDETIRTGVWEGGERGGVDWEGRIEAGKWWTWEVK